MARVSDVTSTPQSADPTAVADLAAYALVSYLRRVQTTPDGSTTSVGHEPLGRSDHDTVAEVIDLAARRVGRVA